MTELAFRVKKDSKFYNKYFETESEKQKFHDLAREFFIKYDLIDNAKYYQEEFLALQLNEEQIKRFEGQLKKYTDKNDMRLFKKNSVMQKEWTETVVNKVRMNLLRYMNFWYFPYISHGSYALWHKDDEIYGYLKELSDSQIKLSDDMTPIKMSEYYAVYESFGEED